LIAARTADEQPDSVEGYTAEGPPEKKGWWPALKEAVKQLKNEVLALHYALHDPRTPW